MRSSYNCCTLLLAVGKVVILARGGTAPGVAIFPMAFFLFTYKKDVGMVNQ